MPAMKRIGIIGAGAWGTALATVVRRAGLEAVLWAREPEVVRSVNANHENILYLPGVGLDPVLRATDDLAEVADAEALLLVVPTQFLRATCGELADHLGVGVPVVACAKGIELQSAALVSEIVAEALPGQPLAVLSGPTFALEVARQLPTAVTLACADIEVGGNLAKALTTPRFRVYRSDDVVGAEIGGAVKNVLAIACGIVEGRKLGDNARAALITRGLAEMARLGTAKGGKAETLMGLAGIGDLTLTCNAMQSRNFSLGGGLGDGRSLKEILGERISVAEGVHSAAAVVGLAARLGVEVPICRAVDKILNASADIDAIIAELLARPVGAEAP